MEEIRWGVEEIKEEVKSAVLVSFPNCALMWVRKMGMGVGRTNKSRAFDASG
jgi:hypothetical protein